jgi:hypothetical protein
LPPEERVESRPIQPSNGRHTSAFQRCIRASEFERIGFARELKLEMKIKACTWRLEDLLKI